MIETICLHMCIQWETFVFFLFFPLLLWPFPAGTWRAFYGKPAVLSFGTAPHCTALSTRPRRLSKASVLKSSLTSAVRPANYNTILAEGWRRPLHANIDSTRVSSPNQATNQTHNESWKGWSNAIMRGQEESFSGPAEWHWHSDTLGDLSEFISLAPKPLCEHLFQKSAP